MTMDPWITVLEMLSHDLARSSSITNPRTNGLENNLVSTLQFGKEVQYVKTVFVSKNRKIAYCLDLKLVLVLYQFYCPVKWVLTDAICFRIVHNT